MLFEKLKNQKTNNLPFVIYSKPNSDLIIGLFQKNDNLVELGSENGFCIVSFDVKKKFIIPESQCDIYFEKKLNSDLFFTNESKDFQSDSEKDGYIKLVKSGLKAIENKEFDKVVLSRIESFEVQDFDVELTFKKMYSFYPNAFKYCFFHPKLGMYLGATPEQFIKIENSKLHTVALAGTQIVTENAEWNPKEINEQQIVTDYIVSCLNQFSDKINCSKPYNFQAGNLVHIKTDIDAEINEKDIENIIKNLHPTPAVSGFPKENAKEFILKNENYNREFYSGFLGEWKKDFATFAENQYDLFVNLRCMKINKNNVNIYIGCGITKDSNPENEFLETINKSFTMKKVL